jgi:hypothetical protein
VSDEDRAALRDAYWKMYSENCIQARHHETQRSAVASAFIAIAGAVIGIITLDKALTPLDLPLALLLIALGVFGAVAVTHRARSKRRRMSPRPQRDSEARPAKRCQVHQRDGLDTKSAAYIDGIGRAKDRIRTRIAFVFSKQ